MDYSELINDFIDGAISPRDEDKLFAALSSNQSLRGEFRQIIDIEKIAVFDADAFTPNRASTTAIFEKLNIGATVSASGLHSQKNSWFRNNSNAVLSSIASAALVAILFWFFDSDPVIIKMNENYLNNSITKKIEKSKSNQSESLPYNSSTFLDSIGTQGGPDSLRKLPISGSKNILHASDHLINDIYGNDLSQNLLIRSSRFDGAEKLNSNRKHDEQSPENLYSSIHAEYNPPEINISNFDLSKFSVIVKDGSYHTFSDPNVGRSSQPILENVAFAIQYELNENIQIGLNARQEFFYQEYTGIEENNTEYLYKQHTNYVSYGAYVSLYLFEYKDFTLFTDISIGGNKVGPIARASFGLEYIPNHAYSFVFEVEGSSLTFHHQNNYFWSNKLGLHYGIKFNL